MKQEPAGGWAALIRAAPSKAVRNVLVVVVTLGLVCSFLFGRYIERGQEASIEVERTSLQTVQELAMKLADQNAKIIDNTQSGLLAIQRVEGNQQQTDVAVSELRDQVGEVVIPRLAAVESKVGIVSNDTRALRQSAVAPIARGFRIPGKP